MPLAIVPHFKWGIIFRNRKLKNGKKENKQENDSQRKS